MIHRTLSTCEIVPTLTVRGEQRREGRKKM